MMKIREFEKNKLTLLNNSINTKICELQTSLVVAAGDFLSLRCEKHLPPNSMSKKVCIHQHYKLQNASDEPSHFIL